MLRAKFHFQIVYVLSKNCIGKLDPSKFVAVLDICQSFETIRVKKATTAIQITKMFQDKSPYVSNAPAFVKVCCCEGTIQ